MCLKAAASVSSFNPNWIQVPQFGKAFLAVDWLTLEEAGRFCDSVAARLLLPLSKEENDFICETWKDAIGIWLDVKKDDGIHKRFNGEPIAFANWWKDKKGGELPNAYIYNSDDGKGEWVKINASDDKMAFTICEKQIEKDAISESKSNQLKAEIGFVEENLDSMNTSFEKELKEDQIGVLADQLSVEVHELKADLLFAKAKLENLDSISSNAAQSASQFKELKAEIGIVKEKLDSFISNSIKTETQVNEMRKEAAIIAESLKLLESKVSQSASQAISMANRVDLLEAKFDGNLDSTRRKFAESASQGNAMALRMSALEAKFDGNVNSMNSKVAQSASQANAISLRMDALEGKFDGLFKLINESISGASVISAIEERSEAAAEGKKKANSVELHIERKDICICAKKH